MATSNRSWMRARIFNLFSIGVLSAVSAVTLSACGGTASSRRADTSAQSPVTATSPALTTVTGQPLTTTTSTRPADTASTTASNPATTPQTVTTETITAPSNSGGAGLTGSGSASAHHACVAADLHASAVPPNSAPGVAALGFILENVSSQACESGAYPGVGLITAGGSVVAVTTTRSTGDDLGATPVRRIDLTPGAKMSFRITLHDANASSGACASYSGVQIIPPNDTAHLRVTIPEGPVQSCGSVAVSPVEPGEDGTGQ